MITSMYGYVSRWELAAMRGVTDATLRSYISRRECDVPPHDDYDAEGRPVWREASAMTFADRPKARPARRRPGTRKPTYRVVFGEDDSAWGFMNSVELCFAAGGTSLECSENIALFGADVLGALRELPGTSDGHVGRYNQIWFGGVPYQVETL